MAPQCDRETKNLLDNIDISENYGTLKFSFKPDSESGKADKRSKKNGLFQIFQYANNVDKYLMSIGALCAIIQGSCFPILSVIFGQMTNVFIQHATQGFSSAEQLNNSVSSLTTNSVENVHIESINLTEFQEQMTFYSRAYLIIAVCVLITGFFQTFSWELVAERQVYRLRKIFFTQLLRQEISWFDQNEIGDLSVKLSDDLERVREGIGCKFSLVIQYLSTFVSGILVGLYVNWRLTCIILIMGPFLIGVSSYIAKISASSSAREQLKYAIAGSIAEEVLTNIRTVAAFCKELTEMKRYKTALEEGRKIAMHKYLIISYGLAVVFFLMYTSYGLAFYFGASLVTIGLCTPGSIFTVFFSVMSGAFSVGNALPFINSVSIAVGAARVIFDIIDREPEIDPYSQKGLKPRSTTGHFELKGVSFKYPARPNIQVLHDISLKIEQGKVVAFVGSSGAGKSTLVGLFLRFYDPSEGYITLDGIPLPQLNLNWLRNQIGVVAQEPVLFSASIADNIRYGRSDVTQQEIEDAARIANAHYFIVKLPQGYNTQSGDRGSQLSGGQKQRIAIARALVRNPKILLLDEATSALDAYSEGVVQEALEKAMHGRTTIIIAHRLSTIRNADMIYVVKNGSIAESGKHQDLIARKCLYYNLILAQTLDNIEEIKPQEWSEQGDTQLKRSSRCSSANSICTSETYQDDIEYEEEKLPQVSVWQLLKFNSKEWLQLTVGILACAITGAIMPIFSIFYSEIFVTFTLPKDKLMLSAKFWELMLLVLALVSGIAMFTQTLCLTSAAEKLIMRMRSKAFNNILRQPIGWFDLPSASPGYLITRLARDAPLVKAAAGLRVGHAITAIVTMVSGCLIAFIFGWKLSLMLSVGVPFIAGAAYQQNMILRRNQMRDARLMEVAGREIVGHLIEKIETSENGLRSMGKKIASECIQNIRTVQALGNEKLFVQQYMENLNLPFSEGKKQAIAFGAIYSLSQTVIYLMYAAAFSYGSYLVAEGDMTPSDIYKVFFALTFCASSVGNTFSYVQDFSKAKYAARRMMQLINRKSEIDPTVPFGFKPEIEGGIVFDDVHFTYPSRIDSNVLRGISFKLDPGKTLALVGESGSGKSTVIAILERFYNHSRGKIMVDNYDIELVNLHHLRHNIGLVTQEPNLFDRSIKDNIAYGLSSKEADAEIMQKVIQAAKNVNIHNFITSLPQGYDTMVGEKGTQLSGGQKQRIAIARALVKNPRILLLDEATSALDTECEKVVQEALDRAREGRTCITIAHRLSTIHKADIIAVVHRGKVIEQGIHKDLIVKRGYYFKLTERQQL